MTARPDWAEMWASVRRGRAELGRSLAQWRRSRHLSQEALADLVRYSRSTVANAEIGRGCPARPFWQAADNALETAGVLLVAWDEVDAIVRAQQRVEAQAGVAGVTADAVARKPGFELRELRPHASPRHFLGGELRAWRLHRGLSLDTLGLMASVTASLLGRIEKAERTAAVDVMKACDTALETGGALARLLAYTVTLDDLAAAAAVTSETSPPAPVVIQIITDGHDGDYRRSRGYPVPVSGSAQVLLLDTARPRRR